MLLFEILFKISYENYNSYEKYFEKIFPLRFESRLCFIAI